METTPVYFEASIGAADIQERRKEDKTMASEFLTADPFVAFVGAGGSALPPSNLPTWTEFNSLLLECLCERLAEFSENRQPVAEILALFQKRRDQTRFFSPDFQAQLMEEELGVEYFRVWRSLETDAYGPMHAQLAELGARGRLAAIITTNFDRLLETALAARSLPYAVFYDEASFGLLARRNKGIALPVIKIHGSIEDPMSLVDTLRQRVAGRPASLQNVLNGLLRRFPWIYLGFSGADFSYEPNYLNGLGSAKDARGLTFITRPGSTVKEGVRVLEKEYGPAKASIVTGDLATWLAETFGLGQCLYPDAAPGGVAAVRQKISEWTASLGPMAVVNIFWSMLKSAGMEYQAFWLMRKTWKSYRRPEDASAKSYARYNYNYGKSLLEARFIARPVAREKDNSNYWEWKEEADQDAVQFLHRSYVQGKLAVAGAALARALAYRGARRRASGIVNGVTNEVLASGSKLVLCDVAAASAAVYDILQMF